MAPRRRKQSKELKPDDTGPSNQTDSTGSPVKTKQVREKAVQEKTTSTVKASKRKALPSLEEEELTKSKKPAKKRAKTSPKKPAKIKSGRGDAKTVKKGTTKADKTKRVRQKKKITTEVEGVKEEVVSVDDKAEVDQGPAAAGQRVSAKMASSLGAKFVGAHMGITGGLHNAVLGAVEIGAKAFALFLRSQRQWQAKPLEDKVAEKFREACKEHNFSPRHILPHGSYLLNCGSPNPETLQKTRDALTDELKRCEKLGLTMYNFHPGSTCGQISVEECLDKIGESINLVHKQTNSVITVVENMSCQGNTVGGKFEELKGIIDRVDDKTRVGVCLDTCHAFAAGFDLATESGYESMMADFDRIIGLKYLKAVHLNDSKGKVGSHLDRHENIGKGHIGRKAFKRLMNDPRFDGIPIVIETPAEDDFTYEKEIRLLYSMQGAK